MAAATPVIQRLGHIESTVATTGFGRSSRGRAHRAKVNNVIHEGSDSLRSGAKSSRPAYISLCVPIATVFLYSASLTPLRQDGLTPRLSFVDRSMSQIVVSTMSSVEVGVYSYAAIRPSRTRYISRPGRCLSRRMVVTTIRSRPRPTPTSPLMSNTPSYGASRRDFRMTPSSSRCSSSTRSQ